MSVCMAERMIRYYLGTNGKYDFVSKKTFAQCCYINFGPVISSLRIAFTLLSTCL
jgi:hypothetical protein